MDMLGCGCGSALVLAAAITLLLVPVDYLMSSGIWHRDDLDKLVTPVPVVEVAAPTNRFSFANIQSQRPSLDLFPSIIMLVVGVVVYLFEWIHRTLMERRIFKLRQLLSASTERLRAAEQQQAQLESTLRLARGAATEYDLLLYLLLRRRRTAATSVAKDDDFALLSVPPLKV